MTAKTATPKPVYCVVVSTGFTFRTYSVRKAEWVKEQAELLGATASIAVEVS